MTLQLLHIRRVLHTTALGTLVTVFFLAADSGYAAFNPNEGVDVKSALPSTAPLVEPSSRFALPAERRIPMGNPAPITSMPPGAFLQPTPAIAPSPIAALSSPPGAFIQPIPPIANVTPIPTAPVFPSVDPDVAEKAARELGIPAPIPVAATDTTPGFIAPAPLLAGNPEALQHPVENPAVNVPLAVGSIPPVTMAKSVEKNTKNSALDQPLSNASKDILSKFPSKLDSTPSTVSTGKNKNLAINRLSPEIQAILPLEQKVERYDATGISIKVQRPGLDTNFELNRAYTALNTGDSVVAATTYKNILSTEPRNEDALFGLATTYHRLGDLVRARPYYAQLLTVNPNHREGLNNFLALVSSESPQEALAELERLEQRNPNFSPIPAQQATLLSKTGFAEQAREKMLRAIELAPENLTYKYNLAVMLDKQGKYTDASALYRLLIDAAIKGHKIPSSLDALQKRLNYIATANTAAGHAGG